MGLQPTQACRRLGSLGVSRPNSSWTAGAAFGTAGPSLPVAALPSPPESPTPERRAPRPFPSEREAAGLQRPAHGPRSGPAPGFQSPERRPTSWWASATSRSVHSGLTETRSRHFARSRCRRCSFPATTKPRTRCARLARAGSGPRSCTARARRSTASPFFGLGAGVPGTPWDWSFDLTEEAASRAARGMSRGLRTRSSLPAARPRRRQRHRRAPGQRGGAPHDREQAAPPGPLRSYPRELGRRIEDRADPGNQPGTRGDAARGLDTPAASPLRVRCRRVRAPA